MNEADCACVSEAVVLAEEGREAVSLRIRLACLALSRLPGSLKLFDDRTGQHHCRWGGSREGGVGAGGGVWKPVICIQLFLSSCPAPLPSSSSHSSLSLPSPLLFLCCFAPSLRPLQSL